MQEKNVSFDYIGNEQKLISEIGIFSTVIGKLTSYYGIGHVSYVDVIRHFVFADTTESWFSPDMWPERNVHPGRGFHIVTPWLFLYYSMNLLSSHCNRQENSKLYTSILQKVEDLPKLPGSADLIPNEIPPILNETLNLDNISLKWKSSEIQTINCTNEKISFCRLAFIDNFPGAVNERQLRTTLNDIIKLKDGWDIVTERNWKVGIKAIKKKALLELVIPSGPSNSLPVSVITFFSLKSYGKTWANSKVKISISSKKKSSKEIIYISGVHEKKTSETFKEKLYLENEFGFDEEILISFELISGTAFKIIGLTLCSF